MTTTPNPTAEQIERAAETFYEDPAGLTSWTRLNAYEPDIAERYRVAMGRALTAAGVAPMKPPALDPEKVAEVIAAAQVIRDVGEDGRTSISFASSETIARALCEAYTEGKLT